MCCASWPKSLKRKNRRSQYIHTRWGKPYGFPHRFLLYLCTAKKLLTGERVELFARPGTFKHGTDFPNQRIISVTHIKFFKPSKTVAHSGDIAFSR
jgi:hypothetical protein